MKVGRLTFRLLTSAWRAIFNSCMAAITAFNREVNAQETDPAFIASTRKRSKMSQQEAAVAFGVGRMLLAVIKRAASHRLPILRMRK